MLGSVTDTCSAPQISGNDFNLLGRTFRVTAQEG
jgi:hypothetical protein